MEKKYDNILTVILVIAIAATLVLTGFWIYDTYTKNKVDNESRTLSFIISINLMASSVVNLKLLFIFFILSPILS